MINENGGNKEVNEKKKGLDSFGCYKYTFSIESR